MPVRVDEDRFEAVSRVAGVAVAAHAMRTMERWRTSLADNDSVMIMIAVIAISAARLLREDGLPAGQQRLAEPIDRSLLARVNIAGIAHATGLNRETARRKVNALIAAGQLVRAGDGSIAFPPGLAQSDRIRDQARAQIGEIAAIANHLIRLGVLVEEG